jgi:hypothetical protein
MASTVSGGSENCRITDERMYVIQKVKTIW